jgi:hypothetical protein
MQHTSKDKNTEEDFTVNKHQIETVIMTMVVAMRVVVTEMKAWPVPINS